MIETGNNNRIHVGSKDWADCAATDFWLVAGSTDLVTVQGAANTAGLSGWGWTATSLNYANLVTADFFSSADDTPPQILTDSTGDTLASPSLFGSYSHCLMASKILGYLPTKLICEFYAAFTVASANESTSNIGLHNGAALVASIYSDGTNFQLSNGATTDAGTVVDNAWHTWRIETTSGGTHEWFIDGTSQGTLAITADVWPAAFLMTSTTTNRQGLAWVHVWYG